MEKLTIDIKLLKDLKMKNPSYIRNVISNLRGFEKSTVVFGTTGKGYAPNYEVTLPNEIKLTRNGVNHKPYKFNNDIPKDERFFNPDNLSEPFSLSDLKNL